MGANAAGLMLAAFLTAGSPAQAEAPARVVSINLCTDQLALMLAEPGQLLSVSRLSQDPRSSPMAAQAAALPANGARAEDVFLYHPDLVIAGTFSSRATVEMLRRLDVRVVELAPAYALADVPDRLRIVGDALGRSARAEALVAEFERDLNTLRKAHTDRPRAALYYANGYTNGERTLAGDILKVAGFANISTELGLSRGGFLALEQIVMADPDLVVTGQPHRGAARAEAVLEHPALMALNTGRVGSTDRDWICGTPHVLRAVRHWAEARRAFDPATETSAGEDP